MTSKAAEAIESAVAENKEIEIQEDTDILQFINGSDFQLTDAASEALETALPSEYRMGWADKWAPTRATLVSFQDQPRVLSAQEILMRLSLPKTAVPALHAVWIAKKMLQGTTGNMDVATMALLVGASCGKLDCPIGLKTNTEFKEYRRSLDDLGVGIPSNIQAKHSALSIKVIATLCDPTTLKAVNALLSAIAVLGFTRSHALGTLAGIQDDTLVANTAEDFG